MKAPKIVWEKDKENSVQDKEIIKVLIKRLNDDFKKKPELAKKAALIIEHWLKKKN